MSEILLTAGASVITGAATYLFTRRKYISEVKTNDIENMRNTLRFYIDLVEDNKKRMDNYQNEIEKVNAALCTMREENTELRKQVADLRIELETYKNKEQ